MTQQSQTDYKELLRIPFVLLYSAQSYDMADEGEAQLIPSFKSFIENETSNQADEKQLIQALSDLHKEYNYYSPEEVYDTLNKSFFTLEHTHKVKLLKLTYGIIIADGKITRSEVQFLAEIIKEAKIDLIDIIK
ncbi:MAG: hypothetical protein ACON5K_01650 [Bacteroidia bacterium]